MKAKPIEECRVLVTPTSYARDDPRLRTQLETMVGEVIHNTTGRPLSVTELVGMIRGVDGYIAGLDKIDHRVIEAADCLQVIARYGVGVDAVDLVAAQEKGIVVTNTPGANAASVAELTIGLMLSLARTIPTAVEKTRRGQWPRINGISLTGKVVGLIGFGSIGVQVARRLQGFECTLLTYDPIVDQKQAAELNVDLLPLNDVIKRADFLSLHCPLNEDTKGMVDTEFLAKMKAGAYLINTARGELINEPALQSALMRGKLQGAALDVFSKQPPVADDPLLALTQVLVTPHMGAHTDGATNAMGWGALNDCLAVLRGEEPIHRVI
jgi:D-3-phosphoglycerate dehydrogenase